MKDFSNSNILKIHKINKSVNREKHRMKAFIRFKKVDSDLFYAECEPDFDVLPLIIKHFSRRYANQKWIIFDSKRKYGIFYDLTQVQFIQLEKNSSNIINSQRSGENYYEQLWSTYFERTNIKSRKNTKLFIQHVPKRYWKHLTELK